MRGGGRERENNKIRQSGGRKERNPYSDPMMYPRGAVEGCSLFKGEREGIWKVWKGRRKPREHASGLYYSYSYPFHFSHFFLSFGSLYAVLPLSSATTTATTGAQREPV